MQHPTRILVSRTKFINNLQTIRKNLSKNTLLCLPVKANAYGHDISLISKLAEQYVDYLAVANLEEGVALRRDGISKNILVFGAFYAEQITNLIKYNLEISISSLYKAKLVEEYCRNNNCQAKIHLKIDTGMNRIGISMSSARTLVDYVSNNPAFILVGIYSHFASSDSNQEFTAKQFHDFLQIVEHTKSKNHGVIAHIANSAAMVNYPEMHLDMVRPGILSYGYNGDVNYPVEPVMSLVSKIVYYKRVKANTGISYNHTYHTADTSNMVTIPIGYGDGYRRGLSNKSYILLHGKKYPIVGNICMDLLMVNLGNDSGYVEEDVVLLGRSGSESITADDLAKYLDTISYEILTGFTSRIPRILD